MKFSYLGKKENMMAFGYDFSEGATPDITDEKAIKKLQGNSHFRAIEEAESNLKEGNEKNKNITPIQGELTEGSPSTQKNTTETEDDWPDLPGNREKEEQ